MCAYDLRPQDNIGGHVPAYPPPPQTHFIFEAGSLITLIHRPDWLANETQACQPPYSYDCELFTPFKAVWYTFWGQNPGLWIWMASTWFDPVPDQYCYA